MTYRINWQGYAQGQPTYNPVDMGAGLRALAEQNLTQQRMAENTRQYDTGMEQRQKEHQDTVEHEKQVSHDINARFATTKSNDIQQQRHTEAMQKHAKASDVVNKARAMVVSGRWNEALALAGQAKDEGADVTITTGPDGKPVFDLKAPAFNGPELQGDFNSIYGQVSGEQQPEQSAPNPYDAGNLPTSAASLHTPEASEHPYPWSGPGPNVLTDSEGGHNAVSQTTPEQATVEGQQGLSPTRLDTSQLQNWTNMRLDPVLSGIEGGIPGEHKSEGRSFLQGFKALGQTPEGTLETLQNPFNTVAGLWRSQDASQGAMARAYMGQGSQESNRDLRVQDMGWKYAQQVSDRLELPKFNIKYKAVNGIDQLLAMNNPNVDSQVLHGIRNMFQQGVATQPDIDSLQYGVGKGLLQRLIDVTDEQVLGTALNPDTRANLRQFMNKLKVINGQNLKEGAQSLDSLLNTAKSDEEALSVIRQMNAIIPRDLWTPKQIELNKRFSTNIEDKPSIRSGPASTNKSVSASASGPGASATVNNPDDPTSDENVQRMIRELQEETDALTRQQ